MARSRNKEKIKVSREAWKKSIRIFSYLRPYRLTFGIGLFFLLLTGATALIFPELMGRLVDSAKDSDYSTANQIALVLCVILVAQSIFSFFRVYLFVSVTEKSLANLRNDIYQHLIRLPMTYFNQKRVGELNSRMTADLTQIQSTLTTTIAEFLRQLILIIGGLTLLTFISPKLTLMMLAIVPVLAIFAVIFGRFIRSLSREAQDKVAESTTIIEETLQGIAIVKSFTNELFESVRFRKSVDEIVRVSIKGGIYRGIFAAFIIFCIFGAIVAVVWMGVRMSIEGSITIGELISFVLYSVFVGASIGGIAELYAQIQRAVGGVERLMDILEENPENIPMTQISKEGKNRIRGKVAFENVHFSYPTRQDMPVLNGVTFDADTGETIAIVGPSGAGKTTITALILRFYDISSGSIRVDDREISDYPLSELRAQMAIVPQDVILFGGTIRENIAYGKPDASQQEIEEAARKANAEEFIRTFPEGYDTMVGERGIQLSGGQRQRIAIARAVLKDPAILILDEATSSLDSESERLVQEALDELMKGRTSFVVAHRLATVRNADRILVVQDGKVVESGTHHELIAHEEGLYRHLSNMQFEIG
ncbi:MAG: ATP-binding cassette domain-containing protein [Cryomorphaceae bacterium]|nr:MAG: ATP-binding cassette domain-containing protein [Cryomorphaceae bacterium]